MKRFVVTLFGNTNTGKTSVILRYVNGTFDKNATLTVIPEQFSHKSNGCELQIYDTAGSESWQSLNSCVYHQSNAIIFLCSYDNQQSVSDINEVWLKRVYEKTSNVPIFLAVNKYDLPDSEKLVDINSLNDVKESIKAVQLFDVSAKDNYNITELFDAVAEYLMNPTNQNEEKPTEKNVDIKEQNNDDPKKKCSC